MLNWPLLINWLSNYLVSHVFELLKNLKTNKEKAWGKFWSCNLICEEVATSNLSHIICFPFLVWTLYKQRGVVIQFQIKKCVHMEWVI
jgi:hypothetical protein